MRNRQGGTTKGPRHATELDPQVDELEPTRVHVAVDRTNTLTLLHTCWPLRAAKSTVTGVHRTIVAAILVDVRFDMGVHGAQTMKRRFNFGLMCSMPACRRSTLLWTTKAFHTAGSGTV